MDVKDMKNQQIYFQTQKVFSNQCGRCSINNLIGKKKYEQKDMIKICLELSNDFINPHKHIFGGDYDANVIIIALQKQGYNCKWLDNRQKQKFADKKGQKLENVHYIINQEGSKSFFANLFRYSGRHWFCVRSFRGKFYQLNSKATQAEQLQQQINTFILKEMKNGSHIIEVTKKEQKHEI